MRVVVQRVKSAKVTNFESGESREIRLGLFVLVGVTHEDSVETAQKLAEKVYKLRVMADNDGKMNKSVADVEGEFLVVSQFTLYGDARGGNRPSFVDAAAPDHASKIYDAFVEKLRELGSEVKTGFFGEYMEIETICDGPVTILIES